MNLDILNTPLVEHTPVKGETCPRQMCMIGNSLEDDDAGAGGVYELYVRQLDGSLDRLCCGLQASCVGWIDGGLAVDERKHSLHRNLGLSDVGEADLGLGQSDRSKQDGKERLQNIGNVRSGWETYSDNHFSSMVHRHSQVITHKHEVETIQLTILV